MPYIDADEEQETEAKLTKFEAIAKAADEALADLESVSRPSLARLALALYDLDPNAIHGKDNCTCDDAANCDECSTVADTVEFLRKRAVADHLG